MPTPLAAQPATQPLPTGDAKALYASGGGAQLAWPGSGNFLYANGAQTIPMEIGTWQKPYRYWLAAVANFIYTGPAAWTRADAGLRLVDAAGNNMTDLNGIGFFQQISVRDSEGGGWQGYQVHGRFYCEAGYAYRVRLISLGGGGGASYYSGADVHLAMYGYTIGEGVY